MAQNFNDNSFQGSHLIATDMQVMENNFACLKSMFSGPTAPSNIITGMHWYDTSKKLHRYRNFANNTWMCSLPLDTSARRWEYRNDAPIGMVLVTSETATGRVLGVRGGSYGATGGADVGDWDIAHAHDDGGFYVNTRHKHSFADEYGSTFGRGTSSYGTNYQGSTGQSLAGTSDTVWASTWRPAAAIGVMLKIDA